MATKKVFSITAYLIIVNFLVFTLALILLIFRINFAYYLGITPSEVMQGKNLWTIFTNMFMHASPSHLFVNMLSLFFLGSFLERILGRKRFLIFYLISGVFAGLFFVITAWVFQAELNVAAVGASGAIFGIAGALAILTPKLPVYIMFIPIPIPMWIASILILGLMWLFSAMANLPIGNTAHLGGLIAGMIYGTYLRKKYSRKVSLLNKYLMRGY